MSERDQLYGRSYNDHVSALVNKDAYQLLHAIKACIFAALRLAGDQSEKFKDKVVIPFMPEADAGKRKITIERLLTDQSIPFENTNVQVYDNRVRSSIALQRQPLNVKAIVIDRETFIGMCVKTGNEVVDSWIERKLEGLRQGQLAPTLAEYAPGFPGPGRGSEGKGK